MHIKLSDLMWLFKYIQYTYVYVQYISDISVDTLQNLALLDHLASGALRLSAACGKTEEPLEQRKEALVLWALWGGSSCLWSRGAQKPTASDSFQFLRVGDRFLDLWFVNVFDSSLISWSNGNGTDCHVTHAELVASADPIDIDMINYPSLFRWPLSR